MMNKKVKFILVMASLLAGWALVLWLQWQTESSPQIGMLIVPSVMLLLGLLAGIALEEEETFELPRCNKTTGCC